MFEGFKNLESLDLQHVELSRDGLEAPISRCPLLKILRLGNLERFKQINVEAGNLEWLEVEGDLQDVAFGVMNRLESYLAIGNVPQTPPNELVHLKHLFTCIDFNIVEEILTVMCLIRSSPQLKHVDFQNRAKDEQTTRIGTIADFWEDHRVCCLEQLQVVSMLGFPAVSQSWN
ncbi:hypothetical protein NL676_025748 [Syzygium grande]|nr:hypothetical protein NL676_025748 [Syzygium grande]